MTFNITREEWFLDKARNLRKQLDEEEAEKARQQAEAERLAIENANKPKAKQKPKPQETPEIITPADIDTSKYIIHPTADLLVPLQQSHNGMNYENTMREVYGQGERVMTPKQFIDYFMAVKQASEGKQTLSYADNSQLTQPESKEIWNFLSSTNRTKGDLWMWLNGMFKQQGTLRKKWTLEKVTGIKNGNLITTSEPLENCLMQDTYVNLKFNNQGLPTEKSQTDEYKQGTNLKYWYPRNGGVAWFGADSDGAGLGCIREPDYHDDSLGVFSCREATHTKNSGGNP